MSHEVKEGELEKTAKAFGVTPARLKAAREYAVVLKKQEPRIKLSTIRKKVAEKFKIKLV